MILDFGPVATHDLRRPLKPVRSNRLAHKPNMKLSLSITTALATLPFAAWVHGAGKPHGLFIAVDDVNDWIG